MDLHGKLLHTLTEYDRKQSTKQGYNPYALPQYMEALQSAMTYIDKGKDVRAVLCGHFTGRLLAAMLKAANVAPMTRQDAFGSGIRRTSY